LCEENGVRGSERDEKSELGAELGELGAEALVERTARGFRICWLKERCRGVRDVVDFVSGVGLLFSSFLFSSS
jgi:hypothetical protein